MKPYCIILLTVLSFIAMAQKSADNFKDPRDNKIYQTVKIGNQTWLAENLKFETKGAVAPKSDGNYGLLYTWEVAQSACPTGWHLPNETEWKELITALGGKYAAGGKMKSNTAEWKAPNKLHAQSSGFNATPAGTFAGGSHKLISESALYWSSEAECTSANTVILNYGANFVDKKVIPKTDLLSVRCLKQQ